LRSASEAAIICNILSMSFLQKGKLIQVLIWIFRELQCFVGTSP